MARLVGSVLVLLCLAAIIFWATSPAHRDRPPMEVHDLLAHGEKFDGKVISVRGTAVTGIALFSTGGFILQDSADSSSRIIVLSRRGVPPLNSLTVARGLFRQAIQINQYRYDILVPPQWCEHTDVPLSFLLVVSIVCANSG